MRKVMVALFVIAGTAASGAASAERIPLARNELARCATQVQSLRQESSRLLEQNARLDARRIGINQRAAALDAEAASAEAETLKGGLALRERRKRYNEDTAVFNADIEHIKREINSVNQVKVQYDQNCSNRPYRRADLEALPEDARTAMRAGLSDVSVPYID